MARRRLIVALAVLAAGVPTSADAAGLTATLARQMRAAGHASGALAVDLDSGQVIYSLRPDAALVPASVEKLYTTSTALIHFGADGTLNTTALAQAAPDADGVIDGDLVLHGAGDPGLDRTSLADLAEAVASAGVTHVTGDIVGDESAFDTLRGPPSEGYRASVDVGPLSALAFGHGWAAGANPGRRLASLFRNALRTAGVKVAGSVRAGVAPAPAVTIASHPSLPMQTLIRLTNVPSDNWYAETLLKALAVAPSVKGTTAAGAAVVRSTVGKFGLHPRVVDGSGLSRGDRTTPRQVVSLLTQMDGDDLAEPFANSLAIAGHTGTLTRRMRGTAAAEHCRGKTGTLIGVSNLAGYCETASGARVAFAILMNHVNPYGARRLQDRMVAALARYAG